MDPIVKKGKTYILIYSICLFVYEDNSDILLCFNPNALK
jgi:hypothetical protein